MKTVKVIISVFTIITILFSLVTASYVPAVADTEISATDSNVRYSGHWVKSGSAMKGYFQSTAEVRFTGTSLKIKTNKPLAVKIDGGSFKELSVESGIVTAASGLAAGEHKAVIMLPLPDNNAVISGYIIDSGAKLLKPDSTKSIMFIGDCITAGYYGEEKWDPNDLFKDSIVNTYVVKTAEKMGLVPCAVAYKGMAFEATRNKCDDNLGMFDRSFMLGEYLSDAANTPYDTKSYTPDYVVVALGTIGSYENTVGVHTNDSAQKKYENYLEKIRSAYPNATIFCLSPFQISDAYNADLTYHIIKTSIRYRQSSGDKNVFYIAVSTFVSNTDKLIENPQGTTTDGFYPTYATHELIAEKLVEKMKGMLDGTDPDAYFSDIINKMPSRKSSSSSKKNITSAKPSSSSKKNTVTEITATTVESTNQEEADTVRPDEESRISQNTKQDAVSQYLWILIAVAAVVVIALLVVIFLPQIKKLFKK